MRSRLKRRKVFSDIQMRRLASGVLSVFRSQKQVFNGSLLTPSILADLLDKDYRRCNSLLIVTFCHLAFKSDRG